MKQQVVSCYIAVLSHLSLFGPSYHPSARLNSGMLKKNLNSCLFENPNKNPKHEM